jgi:predicted DNA-binding transcriptional regulator AlpA
VPMSPKYQHPKQKPWLHRPAMNAPRRKKEKPSPSIVAERTGMPYLLDRHQVVALANVSYPVIWKRMQNGTFPRSHINGGKTVWLSDEILAWMRSLPIRRLKADKVKDANK